MRLNPPQASSIFFLEKPFGKSGDVGKLEE
jgi:hypothetical protein